MRLQVFSGDVEKWQDVARRLRHVRLVHVGDSTRASKSPAADLAVFDGAVEAEPDAIGKAIAAGMNVLVLAAPCLPIGVPKKLWKQARDAGRAFACLNPDRMLPSRALIQSRLGTDLGSPELVRIHRRQSHEAADMAAPLGLPSDLVGEIEQAIWFVQRPIRGVFATESRPVDSEGAGGERPGRSLLVHLSFDPGMAIVDYDDTLPAGIDEAAPSYRFLSVIGSGGSAQIDDQRNSQLLFAGGAPRALTVDEGVRHLAAEIDRFASRPENEVAYADGVDVWEAAARVVDAVLNSLKTRDVVVPEGL